MISDDDDLTSERRLLKNRVRRRGIYLLPNLFTTAALFAGFYAIVQAMNVNFDYAAIADIHAMKRQIHAVRGHERVTVPGHDVKLGRGGIREVEFFVQTQQLVFGGRRPALRGRRGLLSSSTVCRPNC